jgi:small subunit ribosomal protein S20
LPNIASSKRQVRTDERRTIRNKSVRTRCKSDITKAEKQVSTGNSEEAQKAVKEATSTLDKAAGKGIIHSNNAARRKARLAAKLNKAAGTKPATK